MNTFSFPLMRMRPSEREWMLANIEHDYIRVMYFEELMHQLLRDYGITTLIDDIWVAGIEHRPVFARITSQQQAAIAGLESLAARCYMNGIQGKDWNEGIPELA